MRTPHRRGNPTGPTLPALLRVCLDIALLRSGPQVLPASLALLALCLLLNAAAFVAVAATTALEAHRIATLLAAGIALDVVGLALVLGVARRQARYLQTLTALFGTGAIMQAALLPVAGLLMLGGEALAPLGALADIAVRGWSLAVAAHVLRHALDVAWLAALAVATAWMFVSLVAQSALVSA